MNKKRNIWLVIGTVILLRDDPDYATFYLAAIEPLSYPDKLDAMEYVPVTSLMNMHQFAEYLNEIDQQVNTNPFVSKLSMTFSQIFLI